MPKKSPITYKYNPALSVKENAVRCGVSVAVVRNHIQRNAVDRRYDRKQSIIDDCRNYLKKYPNATKAEIGKKLGYSLTTIRKYWEYINSEIELTDFNQKRLKNVS